ncbi:GNAT family N-acetyltransferase [Leifsonia sp. 2MCAF36]|uniref:GNAT family N-acetyltransferase n=1 Tax=Leifsonia sp. 2MCAF36 TaxID=3232988 RepID=UPI003F9D3E50
MPAADALTLDLLADRGWPALEREELDGWVLRASGGVTNRANSVLTAGAVPDTLAAIERAERWYADRSLPAVFQLSPASPAALPEALSRRGYRQHSHTDILVADRAETAAAAAASATAAVFGSGPADARVRLSDNPDDAWLTTWWSVDGRGGDAERDIAERILTGGPALYASVGDPSAPDAVARLALVDEWGGLYAVATRSTARRRGLARALAGELASATADRGVRRLWLQVLADNAAAHALYASLGFRWASGYSYWSASTT